MPDLLRLIRTRRSIRKFKDSRLSPGSLLKILQAGRWAPSGLNNQPWKFLLIKDRQKLKQISILTKYSFILGTCQSAIFVFLDNSKVYDKKKDYMALGAAIENMCLQAHSLNIGSCWLGEILNKKTEVKTALGIKDPALELACVIALGKADEKPKGERRRLGELLINA